MKRTLTAALLLIATTAVAEDLTNCQEPEILAGWQALLDKYPTDHDLRDLYHLRGKICEQIASGLDVEAASARFENARQRLAEKWEQQNMVRGGGAGGG